MLLMVEKDIQGGICHFIYQYKKANTNTKYIKDYDKNNKIVISSILGCKHLIWLCTVAKTSGT